MNGIKKFKNDLEKNLNNPVVKKEIIENIMDGKNPNIKGLLNKDVDIKPLEKLIIAYITALNRNGDYIDLQFDIFWGVIQAFCSKELIEWMEERIDVNTKSF
jgi:hypothetical protein